MKAFDHGAIAALLETFARAPADALAQARETDADSSSRIATALMQQQRVPMALAFLEQQLVRWPNSGTLHAQRGFALRLTGRAGDAEMALRRALALQPAHHEACLSLAFLLREQGRLSAAAEVMLAGWRAQPRTRAGDVATLGFLRECQRPREAEIVAAAAVEQWPDDAPLLASAGEVATELGDFAQAHARLARACTRDPARGASWLRLASTRRFEHADDADITAMRAARAGQRGDEVQTCLCFALGKALDDAGDRAQAVALWREGNARAKARQGWNADGWHRYVEQALRAPPVAPLAATQAFRPLFVVGLPRTGTTLAASLLARHPGVRNRGELNWLAALAARLGPRPERAALAAASALYAAQLRQDDAPATWYLDKNPLNFRQLGLALALFPDAKVIHCVRDARDAALSIWSQHFAHADLAWSYDFADIAAFAAGERALMAHWRGRFPQAIHALDYADLVRDSEAELAKLRAFLELPDAASRDDDADSSGFRTASVWQARQAVNTRSLGRWREYAEMLPELSQIEG